MAKSHSVRSYPFITKSQIVARLATDNEFVVECLGVMLSRQTGYEQEQKTTVVRNRAGFMSSHAKKGTALGIKAQGEGLTEEEIGESRELVSRYTKQLAAHFRAQAIATDPSLAEAARVFSAD